jgi:hypothetical protein
MAVTWTKFYETNTVGDMPTTTARNWSQGFSLQNGTLEFLTLRYDLTFGATPVAAADLTSIISSLRVIVNGSVMHDFVAGTAANTSATASQYSYALNKMGGRAVEVADEGDATTRQGYINIPLGVTLNSQGQNRIECIVGWNATGTGATITSGSLEWWGRYNSGTVNGQILAASTTYQHSAASIEQVIVRCPTLLPAGATISGLLVLNDDVQDNIGSEGIRINSLSNFGIQPDQWRMVNSDLLNGVEFNAGSTVVENNLTYAQGLAGALLIPVFNLTLGDVTVTVSNGADATTRRYFPVITYPVGGKQGVEQKQQATVVGSSSRAILGNDLQ